MTSNWHLKGKTTLVCTLKIHWHDAAHDDHLNVHHMI
jgi:hypothetical protein